MNKKACSLIFVLLVGFLLAGCASVPNSDSKEGLLSPTIQRITSEMETLYRDKAKTDTEAFLAQFGNNRKHMEMVDAENLLNEEGNLALLLEEGFDSVAAEDMVLTGVGEPASLPEQDGVFYRAFLLDVSFAYANDTIKTISYIVKEDGKGLVSIVARDV
jgi:outer membrane murein-binding lipoprotein Lpp